MNLADAMHRRDAPHMDAKTPSGLEIPVVVSADMIGGEEIGLPGSLPFTRSIFADGYRGRLWTMRQYSGFGSAEETNQRYRFLLSSGVTGLSVALDLPTQCGYDPDDPLASGEVGRVGVSISSLRDFETLFGGIDLASISTSFTINGTAAILYAMYVALADKRGIPRARLTGTVQNDILKEYVARGTWIFPVRPSMRLVADSILFAAEQTPRFNPISIAGAHVRDAGATAIEEMGLTLANGLCYVRELVDRGADPNSIAQRLSFFFYVHMDLFEEVAKFRAGRRLWAKLLQEQFNVSDPKALMFRFGVVCGGSSLTASQPYNNIVRVAIENMAAVFGGAQSIFTCAYDEAFQIPTQFSAEIALRTQQIVAYESGIARTVDPLGGSYFVEWLTNQMELEIRKIVEELDASGGVEMAIESGLIQSRIANRAYRRKKRRDAGEDVIVGENFFRSASESKDYGEMFKVSHETAARVTSRLKELRNSRDSQRVAKALDKLAAAAAGDGNLMPLLIECCHAEATLGEMVSCLRDKWGQFKEPVGI